MRTYVVVKNIQIDENWQWFQKPLNTFPVIMNAEYLNNKSILTQYHFWTNVSEQHTQFFTGFNLGCLDS